MSGPTFGGGLHLLHNDFGSTECPWCGRVVKKVLATQKLCGGLSCREKQKTANTRRRRAAAKESK